MFFHSLSLNYINLNRFLKNLKKVENLFNILFIKIRFGPFLLCLSNDSLHLE